MKFTLIKIGAPDRLSTNGDCRNDEFFFTQLKILELESH
jgi:hypothetical protein